MPMTSSACRTLALKATPLGEEDAVAGDLDLLGGSGQRVRLWFLLHDCSSSRARTGRFPAADMC
ncbi:MAG: hypothetical protein ACRDNW_08825 [Trebonia sp.]